MTDIENNVTIPLKEDIKKTKSWCNKYYNLAYLILLVIPITTLVLYNKPHNTSTPAIVTPTYSLRPSGNPTASPTYWPTQMPSGAPTCQPTVEPTIR